MIFVNLFQHLFIQGVPKDPQRRFRQCQLLTNRLLYAIHDSASGVQQHPKLIPAEMLQHGKIMKAVASPSQADACRSLVVSSSRYAASNSKAARCARHAFPAAAAARRKV